MFRSLALAAALAASLAALSAPASAFDPIQDELRMESAWSRATPGAARTGAAYVTFVNKGEAADRVLAASSPVAEAVELHTMERDGDRMRMRPLDAVDLPAGETVKLQPGGIHVMLIGLHEPLKEGDTFPITFTFEKHGQRAIDVHVAGIGAAGPSGMDHGSTNHGMMNQGGMNHGTTTHGGAHKH